MGFLYVCLENMLKFFLPIVFLFLLINDNYAAREDTGYNRGINNKNISIINKLLDNQEYLKSIELITKEIKKDKLNADLYNYLGYAYRKNGNLVLSIKNYKEALNLNPNHSQAHNYIGIAYLKIGQIYKAKKHLKILEGLCEAKCKEYKSLEAQLNKILKNEK